MKIYVKAKSKKEVNEMLVNGEDIIGYNFSMFGDGGHYSISNLNDGDIVAIYQKTINGSPVVKSFGNFVKSKNQLK